MRNASVNRFIFSSSCAVFGYPETIPLSEQHPRFPMSPYGKTKFIVELMLEDACAAYGLQAVNIRYFNAAGALPEYNLGERHDPETHLIPRLFAAAYQQIPFALFGTDYSTLDGTCIRDYIHVMDLASAHLKAVHLLHAGYAFGSFNVGAGKGYSIYEVIDVVERSTGRKIIIQHQPRRAGDPPILIADIAVAKELLQWHPKMSDLETIIDSAHDFYAKFVASVSL
jgi:UDP-glucose-4-epimerase GalE